MSKLDDKLLEDFHGFELHIDESYESLLPMLTNKAIIKLSNMNLNITQFFRIEVAGGGCHGLYYKYTIETGCPSQEDISINENPLLVIDKESLKYMKGSVVDYETSIYGEEFKINNPSVKQMCGCGTSFYLDPTLNF